MSRKTVAMQLPRIADVTSLDEKYSLELEALAPVADIVEVESPTAQAFAEGAAHADAVITSWGILLDEAIISKLEKCVVIGLGSVGVDMVDVERPPRAGIGCERTAESHRGSRDPRHDADPQPPAAHQADGTCFAATRVAPGPPALTTSRGSWAALGLSPVATSPLPAKRARRSACTSSPDPYVSDSHSEHGVARAPPFGELLERSDYVSVHSPHNEETEHLLNAAAFARMKDGVAIVNTARGPIIDEPDLIAAIESGKVGAAGLDVLEQEPPAPDNPLLTMDNVIVTPHVASATTRMRPTARRRVGQEVALVLRGKWPMSCVNPTVLPRTPLERWQPVPMTRGPNR